MMVQRDWVVQRFGSMTSTLIESEEVSADSALEELAIYMLDFNVTVASEEVDEGYDIIVSTSLDEDVIYRIR